jgi:hypothetical protein
MTKIFSLLTIALSFCFSICCYSQSSYINEINKIKKPVIDNENIYDVRDIVINRDVASISLDSGILYFFKPINDRIKLAVFIGKGTFNYQPGTETEVRQLKRMMKKDMIMDGFSKILLFFDDSTYYDIAPYSNKSSIGIQNNKEIKSIINEFIDYELYKDYDIFDVNIGNILFSKSATESFYSYITTDNNGKLFFSINPTEYEEIGFDRGTWDPVDGLTRESINQFHSSEQNQGLTHKETNDAISIESYQIQTKIN